MVLLTRFEIHCCGDHRQSKAQGLIRENPLEDPGRYRRIPRLDIENVLRTKIIQLSSGTSHTCFVTLVDENKLRPYKAGANKALAFPIMKSEKAKKQITICTASRTSSSRLLFLFLG